MSGAFSFPPPPPPPPKAAPDQSAAVQPTYNNNNRGNRGGRGGRDRGGRGRGRGRGTFSQGSRSQQPPYNNGNDAGVAGQYHNAHQAQQAMPNSANGLFTPFALGDMAQANNQGGYPATPNPQSQQGIAQAQLQMYNAFTQFWSASVAAGQYGATPYAQQPNPTLQGGMDAQMQDAAPLRVLSPIEAIERPVSSHSSQSQSSSRGNLRTAPHNARSYDNHAGVHRKTAPGRGGRPSQNSTREKAKVPAPPAVPSFGSPLPGLTPQPAVVKEEQPKKKRKFNQLGLTPREEEHENSDNDVGEEAALATLGTELKFEYKGRTSTLTSPAELAAWIAQRKARFPTRQRVEEKQKQAAEAAAERAKAAEAKRQEDHKRKQEAEAQRHEAAKRRDAEKVKKKEEVDAEKNKLAMEKRLKKAEKLRKKLAALEGKISEETRATPAQVGDPVATEFPEADQGDLPTVSGHETPASDALKTTIKVADSVIPEADSEGDDESDASDTSSDSSSESSSDSDSDSDDSADDSDGTPEEESSKSRNPVRIPPPDRERPLCKNFSKFGTCKFGRNCRFRHERPEKKTKTADKEKEQPKRKSLYQRLVEQEQEQENKLALEAIKELGRAGIFEKLAGGGST